MANVVVFLGAWGAAKLPQVMIRATTGLTVLALQYE